MIQNILRHLGGIQHFGIISMCLFCAVFVGVLFWAFLQKKNHLDYMSRVALDADAESRQARGESHE
jgi:cbb3-type cytochrome oxidase subunit 3